MKGRAHCRTKGGLAISRWERTWTLVGFKEVKEEMSESGREGAVGNLVGMQACVGQHMHVPSFTACACLQGIH